MSDTAANLDTQLVALLNAGNIDGALVLLDSAIAGNPTPTLYLARGRLLLATDQPELALSDFQDAASRAATEHERTHAALAQAETLVQLNRPHDARVHLEHVLASATVPADRLDASRLLASLDLREGLLGAALERLSRLLVVERAALDDTTYAEIALDLAQVLRLIGDPSGARSVLEEVLARVGDDAEWAARVHAQLGTTLAFEGRYALALTHYDLALAGEARPVERARIHYNRAVAQRERADLAAAAADLRTAATELGDTDADLAADIRLLTGVVTREQGDLSASLDALKDAIERAHSRNAEGRARLEVGITLAATGVHGLAAQEFGAALSLCDDEADLARAYRYRASTRKELGLPALALVDVTRALELTHDPDERARGAMTQAALLNELDREPEAYAALRDAPFDEVTNPEVRLQLAYQLGSLAVRRGDLDLALATLADAQRLAHQTGDTTILGQILVNRGVALDVAGSRTEAQASFQQVITLAPSLYLIYQAQMNLGRLAADSGRLQPALDAFGAAATAADDRDARAMAFLSRGSTAMRAGRYVEADADFTRILVLQPSDPIATQARYYRGLTANLLGQLERARADLTITIDNERDRDNRAQALLDRGLIALSAGDFTSATADIREAAQSFRRRARRAEAHVQLAVVNALLGNCAAAAVELQAAHALDPSGAALATAKDDLRLQTCANHPDFAAALLHNTQQPPA